jgi:hypothetical protein
MNAVVEQATGRITALAPGLTVGAALRKAVRGFYDQSFRLALLNTAFSAVVLTILVLVTYSLAALVLLLALGPLTAALMHCAVTIVRHDDLRVADALAGLRLHWRRGLMLGALAAVFIVLTVIAVGFYAGEGALAWPLAVLTLYLAGLLGVFQLSLWPLAVLEPERPLRAVLREAALMLLRRPLAFTGLAAALFVINLLGLVAAVLPFLTMTIAYSFLAAAYFTLPPSRAQEA